MKKLRGTLLPRERRKRSLQMIEMDFHEWENGIALSLEERQFLKKAQDGICQREDMHYQMPLPFREGNVQLPNNLPQAIQRLHGLKRRLQVDDKAK